MKKAKTKSPEPETAKVKEIPRGVHEDPQPIIFRLVAEHPGINEPLQEILLEWHEYSELKDTLATVRGF